MKKICIILFLLIASKTFAQIDLKSNLSDSEKLYGLSLFWSEAKYNFAYFDHAGVNWDSAYQAFVPRVLQTQNTYDYYQELKRFCALLKDGHTDINLPNKLFMASTYVRLSFQNINKRFYVANVDKQIKEKIPIGTELVQVNGLPVLEFLQREVVPFMSASTEHELWNETIRWLTLPLKDTISTLQLVLRKPDGKTAEHRYRLHSSPADWLIKRPTWRRTDFKMIEESIAHIKLNTFNEDSVIYDFKQMLPALYKSKAVIIDLRNNGGGNTGVGAEILKYFTTEKLLIGSKWRTRLHKAAYKAWGIRLKKPDNFAELPEEDQQWYEETIGIAKGDYWYQGDSMKFENDISEPKIEVPLVVLFGNNTASAAEDFLVILDRLKGRAITVGERSFGSTGQPLFFDMPGGGSARICTKRDEYPDGRAFVGYGVKPDIFVEKTVEELIANEDSALEKAVAILKAKLSSKGK